MKERAFTLRLSDEEINALEVLKAIGKEKTDSKIIRYVILRFKSMMDDLSNEKYKNDQLSKELSELKEKVKSFNESFSALKKIK